MRNVVLQMHTTLDGYADSKTGFIPLADRTYSDELEKALEETGAATGKVDTLLLGRGTYKQFETFWPKAARDPSTPKDWREQARFLDETPKVVFSRRLRTAKWQPTTIVRGDLTREIGRLKKMPGKNMLIPGGVAFPRAMIERNLVDEYLLSVVPIIVGQGPDRLFGPLRRQRNLRPIRSWTFSNGVTMHRLRPEKGNAPWFQPPSF